MSTPLDLHITLAVTAKGQHSSQFGDEEPQGKKDNPGQYEKDLNVAITSFQRIQHYLR